MTKTHRVTKCRTKICFMHVLTFLPISDLFHDINIPFQKRATLSRASRVLEDFARPGLFSERIGFFRRESGDQVILHHVLHREALEEKTEQLVQLD